MAEESAACGDCGAPVIAGGDVSADRAVAGDAPVVVDGRQDAYRIIRKWNDLSLALFFGGFIGLAVVSAGLESAHIAVRGLVSLASIACFYGAFICVTKMKGLHWAYGLLVIGGCIGLLAIYLLSSRCRNCRRENAWNVHECRHCGYPVSVRWKPK